MAAAAAALTFSNIWRMRTPRYFLVLLALAASPASAGTLFTYFISSYFTGGATNPGSLAAIYDLTGVNSGLHTLRFSYEIPTLSQGNPTTRLYHDLGSQRIQLSIGASTLEATVNRSVTVILGNPLNQLRASGSDGRYRYDLDLWYSAPGSLLLPTNLINQIPNLTDPQNRLVISSINAVSAGGPAFNDFAIFEFFSIAGTVASTVTVIPEPAPWLTLLPAVALFFRRRS